MLKRLRLARAQVQARAASGWMPGAVKKEIKKFKTPLRSVRGVCHHVAVSEGSSLYGYFSGAKVCSHFYVRKDGTIEQYVSIFYQAPANGAGNSSLVSIETQGGVRGVETEPWTAAQVESLARIDAWVAKQKSVPLILMPNSKRSSVGLGWHRQGVDPYRVDGGELWSSAYAKSCPGREKISQMPQVRDRAKQILAGDPGLPDTGELFTVGQYEDIMGRLAYIEKQNKANAEDIVYVQTQVKSVAQLVVDETRAVPAASAAAVHGQRLGRLGPSIGVALQSLYNTLVPKVAQATDRAAKEEN